MKWKDLFTKRHHGFAMPPQKPMEEVLRRRAHSWGLQLSCINMETHEMERLTPRNLDIAKEMIKSHAWLHGKGYKYWVQDYTPGSTRDVYYYENPK